jgi:hypothetical protein
MRILHIITLNAAILAAILVTGCSKNSSQQSQAAAPPNLKDLGAVELVAGTPTQFSLGEDKGCTITGEHIPNGIGLKLVVLSTNEDGTVDRSQGQIDAVPGQQCAISMGDMMVGLTPTLKTP